MLTMESLSGKPWKTKLVLVLVAVCSATHIHHQCEAKALDCPPNHESQIPISPLLCELMVMALRHDHERYPRTIKSSNQNPCKIQELITASPNTQCVGISHSQASPLPSYQVHLSRKNQELLSVRATQVKFRYFAERLNSLSLTKLYFQPHLWPWWLYYGNYSTAFASARFLRLPYSQDRERRRKVGMIDPENALLTLHTISHETYSFHISALSFPYEGKIVHTG
jgi:hypothetical protein